MAASQSTTLDDVSIALVPGEAEGGVLLVTRHGRGLEARFVTPASFVPCVGALDADAVGSLRAAFARGDGGSGRSLRLEASPG